MTEPAPVEHCATCSREAAAFIAQTPPLIEGDRLAALEAVLAAARKSLRSIDAKLKHARGTNGEVALYHAVLDYDRMFAPAPIEEVGEEHR